MAQEFRTRTAAIAFREWFGLSPAGADILALLWKRADIASLPRDIGVQTGLSPNAIGFHLHFVRHALNDGALEHVRGRGYRLTATGINECRAAVLGVAEDFRALASELEAA